jgi:hypothetical protein
MVINLWARVEGPEARESDCGVWPPPPTVRARAPFCLVRAGDKGNRSNPLRISPPWTRERDHPGGALP